jgi:hypothetical protein
MQTTTPHVAGKPVLAVENRFTGSRRNSWLTRLVAWTNGFHTTAFDLPQALVEHAM